MRALTMEELELVSGGKDKEKEKNTKEDDGSFVVVYGHNVYFGGVSIPLGGGMPSAKSDSQRIRDLATLREFQRMLDPKNKQWNDIIASAIDLLSDPAGAEGPGMSYFVSMLASFIQNQNVIGNAAGSFEDFFATIPQWIKDGGFALPH